MKQHWKTIVELVVSFFCVLVGAGMMTTNWTWPPRLPEWIFLGLGFLVTTMYLRVVEDRWNKL